MNINQLVPASSLAQQYGVKVITYGAPGSGKTPIINTAPSPVALICEPGMLTMRGSNVPCWLGNTGARIEEFFLWAFQSAEAKRFDTYCIDSGSQLAEIILNEKFKTNKDGRKAYGEMSKQCMDWFDGLYFMQQKHVYIICKQATEETVSTSFLGGIPQIATSRKYKPYFPGQDLPMKVSHRYDEIIQANGAKSGLAAHFRCKDSDTITARDRSGKLEDYEPLHLGELFKKAMS